MVNVLLVLSTVVDNIFFMANVLLILSTIIDCIVFIANVSVLNAAAARTTVRIILWASARPCETKSDISVLPRGVVAQL